MIKTPTFKRTVLGISVAMSFAVSAPLSQAESTRAIEEVLVTARKQSETLQDVPFSVAAMTEGKLQRSGATDIESMAANVAGITIQNLGPGQSQVAIRGISAGQIVRDQPGVKEQVGVYMDESVISMSLFTPDLDFYDMNRVEVLRGPQGTLFGSGSLSGTIRYITQQPNFDGVRGSIQGDAETISHGSDGGSLKAHLNVPLSDKVALRMVRYYQEFGGFIDALQPDGSVNEDVNEGVREGGRLAVLFQPNDALSITPKVVFQKIDIDGFNREDDYHLLANPYTTTRPAITLGDYEQYTQLEESFEDDFALFDLTVNYDFNDQLSLTSVSSYTDRDVLVVRDATALNSSITGGSYGEAPSVYLLDAPLYDRTSAEVLTQEFRLSGFDGPMQWVAGVFYSEVERHYSQSLLVDGFEASNPQNPDLSGSTAGQRASTDELYYSDIPYQLDQYAIFGEVSYDLTDKTMLVVGARYFDYEETRVLTFDGIYTAAIIDDRSVVSSNGVSPRVIVRHAFNDDVMLNAQVSQGFRLGGNNDPLNVPLCSSTNNDEQVYGNNRDFDDETVTNYEVGAKTNFMGGAGTFNVSAFHAQIKDLQVTVDAGSCSSRLIYNADEAHSSGVEIELFMRPLSNLEFGLSASFVEAELDSDVESEGSVLAVVGGQDGDDLPTAPGFELAASVTYYFPVFNSWEGFANATYQNVGERYTKISDQNNNGQGVATLYPNVGGPLTQATYGYDREMDSYEIVNLRLGVRNENWDTALFVRNATNEKAELSIDTERGGNARVGHHVNQPRTMGFSARYSV
jgi:iron complex outermembrane receptor protein